MADLRFLTFATDPNLVPGIYNGCDQWCHYCRATDRCLAYKCRPESGGNIYENLEQKMYESMEYLRACHEAEGLQPPEDLLRLLNGERPSESTRYVPLDDALERMGKHYAVLATAFIVTCGEPIPQSPLPKREHGPMPFEVFLYYHVLIAAKIYRAISSAHAAARAGSAHARWDADVSAKVALIGIERSDQALQVMALDDVDPRLEHMRRHLARLEREVAARFPGARTLVRPGLDDVPGE